MSRLLLLAGSALIVVCGAAAIARQPHDGTVIPRTWDDEAVARSLLPLADASASPKHVTTDEYYRIPVKPIYKGYPVYAPGREPAGYLDWLRQQEPAILWDGRGHAPPLDTDGDWIRAGAIVFHAARGPNRFFRVDDVRNPAWYEKTAAPVSGDGTVPNLQYVVRSKGVVEVGTLGCAGCHSRVMPDGAVIDGAQGNQPVQREAAFGMRAGAAAAADSARYLADVRGLFKSIHAAPWLHPDPEARVDAMSLAEIADVLDSVPPATSLRQGTNTFLPIQVPDLIGVRDRRYLDHTGLVEHREIGDMMRYAALSEGADLWADYAGFVPANVPGSAASIANSRVRFSDEQLYALARYLYSLQPPKNPNLFDEVAASGQRVFQREGCAMCHTPPLYTSNRLTPADGFQIPAAHRQRYDLLPISIGTDPTLALGTRRGTGYYKVPSLKGVWYRGMFGHNGWCATLEDWFDSRRLSDDYVPTGWKPHDRRTFAVKGHTFGLNLSDTDRRALIAFLRTL
jgi:hypothetical protein